MTDRTNYLNLRFSEKEMEKRKLLWATLCREFFQQFIGRQDAVLDVGAGSCEFINNISCGKKFALDVQEETLRRADRDVTVIVGHADQAFDLLNGRQVDVVFFSNILEHLHSKMEVRKTLEQIHKVLLPGGKLLLLQPNIRYCYKEYWDFFDHIIPLSHKSIAEVLLSLNFTINMLKPKFLPYSTKSWMPQHPLLVKLYLQISPLQSVFGKQMFIYAEKR